MAGQPSSKAGAVPGSAAATSAAPAKPATPPTIKPLASAPGIAPGASPSKPPPPKLGQPPVIGKTTVSVAATNQTPPPAVPQALRPVPPKNTGSISSEGVGAMDVVPMSLTGTAWPCNVPSVQQALQLLNAESARTAKDGASGNATSSLTEIEMTAVMGRRSSLDLTALKQAVLVRWRLMNALETKPPAGFPIDVAALERLLNEADAALSKMQVPEAATETVRAGYASARGALAKHAVALSEIAAEVAQQSAVEAATHKATNKYQRVARVVAISADTAKTALRSKVLWAGLALSLLGAGAFHGYQYLRSRNPPESGPGYSAAGMQGYKNESTGVAVLNAVDPTKPVDQAELAKLKAEVEASGKRLHRVGQGQYVIAPANMQIMGDALEPPSQP